MKILFIGINPKDISQLRLQDEINIIKDIIDNQPVKNKYRLKVRNAATKSKMLSLIRRYKPNIIHISGHGNDDGTIIFEDTEGYSDIVYTKQLGDLLNNYSSFIKCVILSACYSLNDIEHFSKNIQYTIGMKTAIDNNDALKFSRAFYEELFNNDNFVSSFNSAKDFINLSEESDSDILKFIARKEINPPKPPQYSLNWTVVILIILTILICSFLMIKYLTFTSDLIE